MQWWQRANGEWPAALVFFPLAAGWAVLAVPLSIAALLYPGWAPAALLPPWGHAHELRAGFALAVIFGFLANRVSVAWLLCAVSCWLAARLLFLWTPWHWSALLANSLFGLILLRFAALPFLRTARKWRNQAFVPILLLVALMPVAVFLLAEKDGGLHLTRQWVVGLALLMLFMAGRIMAPLFAGAIRKRGGGRISHGNTAITESTAEQRDTAPDHGGGTRQPDAHSDGPNLVSETGAGRTTGRSALAAPGVADRSDAFAPMGRRTRTMAVGGRLLKCRLPGSARAFSGHSAASTPTETIMKRAANARRHTEERHEDAASTAPPKDETRELQHKRVFP